MSKVITLIERPYEYNNLSDYWRAWLAAIPTPEKNNEAR